MKSPSVVSPTMLGKVLLLFEAVKNVDQSYEIPTWTMMSEILFN